MKLLSELEIKKRILKMLKFVDDICTENNIWYCVAYGTLLGAIRHKGFIPWDDDIDIFINQSDYQRFVDLVLQHDTYGFSYIFNNPNYRQDFGKVIDKETIIKEGQPIVSSDGLFLDVFPLFHIGMSKQECEDKILKIKKQKMKFWYYNTPIRSITGNFIIKILKFLHILPKKIYIATHDMTKYLKKYLLALNELDIKNSNSNYVGYVDNAKTSTFEHDFFEKDWLETIRWPFETIEVNVPKEYDLILRQYFGDYMQLPPEKDRINHNMEAYLKD